MEILLDCPKEVPLTAKEFHSLTVWDISCFFINWSTCIERLDNGSLKIWTNRYNLAHKGVINYRFQNSPWFINESLEIYHCTVIDLKLQKTIEKYFGHLFLKQKR